MATPISAAGTYAQIARLTQGLGAQKPDDGTSFSAVLKQALGAVADAGHKSDAQAQSLVQGKGNMVDVVTAVAETEVAIDAVVAVRDRVIQAYEEIMKMPI